MEVYSIGFTKKTAEEFFGLLKHAKIRRVVDVRLNNVSQLAAFAKREDLKYFLQEICGAEYVHEPLLAPTQEMLDAYKKKKGTWEEYEHAFLKLMKEREIEEKVPRSLFETPAALLCSEETAGHCHRRLVLEYLRTKWGNIEIRHL
jgi:uncharacterized protein (DUF488 family)